MNIIDKENIDIFEELELGFKFSQKIVSDTERDFREAMASEAWLDAARIDATLIGMKLILKIFEAQNARIQKLSNLQKEQKL